MEKIKISKQVISLCGSTKYKLHYQLVNTWLTLEDNVVLSASCFGHSDKLTFQEYEKELLDKVHKDKIYISDLIFIIDPSKYVGHSTISEINYSTKHGKDIIKLSDHYDEFIQWVKSKVDLGWWNDMDILDELNKEKNI